MKLFRCRLAASTDAEVAQSTSLASLEYSRDENESDFDVCTDEVDDAQSYEDFSNNEAISECNSDTTCDGEFTADRETLDSAHCVHSFHEGDHVIRWILLGYCYPVQVHGIVLSVGPELVTIVDCGLTSVKRADKVGKFDEDCKIKSKYKGRRRMNVLTLVDEKEIKKWRKVHYGEECELRVHSTSSQPQLDDDDELPSAEEQSTSEQHHLEYEEEQSISQLETPSQNNTTSAQTQLKSEESPEKAGTSLRLPKSDPPTLVLARLRFLLEYGEGDDKCNKNTDNRNARPPLLPPHHLFYANSECIAVWIKTGHWSTLQASVFLHSSTVGNVKQTATLAMYLSSQTVTVPAAGIWGFFGGTTTVSLFAAQPWLVPALVGGGMVYVGLPSIVLWRAKSQWANTEKTLNAAFWESVDPAIIVKLIQTWSGLEG
jgi:hypothetical protein